MKKKDDEKKKESSKELTKYSGTVEVSNKLGLLGRKAYNVLLANAYPELPTKDIFNMPVSDLCSLIGYESKDTPHLIDELEKVVRTTLRWNILGKDRTEDESGVTTLIAHVKIKGGVCEYSYSPFLRGKLYQPNVYAKIDLGIQKEFRSKHSLALYELCKDYYITKNERGQTDQIKLADLREILGLEGKEYPIFKQLNSRVLKPAIEEINTKSDIFVTYKTFTMDRKVTTIQFFIRHNTRQLNLIEYPKEPGISEVVQELLKRGVTLISAIDLVKAHGEESCMKQVEHFDFLLEEAKAGRVPSEKAPRGGAWLVRAIEEGWALPASFKSKTQKENETKLSTLLSTAQKYFEIGDYESALGTVSEYRALGGMEEKGFEEKIEKAFKEKAEKKAIEDYINGLSITDKETLFKQVSEELQKLGGRWRECAGKPDSLLFGVHLRNHVRSSILKLA